MTESVIGSPVTSTESPCSAGNRRVQSAKLLGTEGVPSEQDVADSENSTCHQDILSVLGANSPPDSLLLAVP